MFIGGSDGLSASEETPELQVAAAFAPLGLLKTGSGHGPAALCSSPHGHPRAFRDPRVFVLALVSLANVGQTISKRKRILERRESLACRLRGFLEKQLSTPDMPRSSIRPIVTSLLLGWPCLIVEAARLQNWHGPGAQLRSRNLRHRNFHVRARTSCVRASGSVELQRDCGRGLAHLSARLKEGDLCVYQVGTWHVDYIPVGSGNPPRLLLARVDVLQLNFAGDHEHGRILGTAISSIEGSALHVREDEPFGAVEFGPEQLIARLPARWASDFEGSLLDARDTLPATLPASLADEEDGKLLPVELGRHEGPGLG